MTPLLNVDQRLREAGFRIASRIPDQEPRWEKGGLLFLQSEAVRWVLEEEVVDLKGKE